MNRLSDILERIDRNEQRPMPASASCFDVSRKYRIVSGEEIDYADTLGDAKYIAGEWQIERERVVEIVKQRGIPKRWAAHPVWHDNELTVDLQPLFADPCPEDAGSRRLQALAKHIDRERRRRQKKKQRRLQIEGKKAASEAHRFSEGVVCISTHPPKPFRSVVDAAAWAGVKQPTLARAIKKGYRCGEFKFRQAGDILKEVQDGKTEVGISIARAATEAVRLSRRKSGVSERQGELHRQAEAEAGGRSTDAA